MITIHSPANQPIGQLAPLVHAGMGVLLSPAGSNVGLVKNHGRCMSTSVFLYKIWVLECIYMVTDHRFVFSSEYRGLLGEKI